MAAIAMAAVAMAVSGVKIPAGALVGLPVGVAVGLGVGVRFVGVEVDDTWIKTALTSRSRPIVMDTGFMSTCTVWSRSQ